MIPNMRCSFFVLLCLCATLAPWAVLGAPPNHKPFILANSVDGPFPAAVDAVRATLEAADFQIVGEYAPYADDSAHVFGITTTHLKSTVAHHRVGGFGAVMRVAVTLHKGKIEVSYTNPPYLGYAYQIGPMTTTELLLRKTLGAVSGFGAEGFSASQLMNYHYMLLMPYFQDMQVAGIFGSHQEAINALELGLAHQNSDLRQVWKVSMEEGQTLFGVQLYAGPWAGQMKNIMATVDRGSPKSTAALPWEILVSGNKVIYLPGEFRIALMFPDLSLNQFMTVSFLPEQMAMSIQEVMRLGVVGR